MIRWVLAFCIWAGMATGQSDAIHTAQSALAQLDAARDSLNAAASARDRVNALTDTVRAYENGLTALRDGLRRAAIRQQTVERQLLAKRDDVGRLLGVLQSMGRAPSPLLLLHPNGPIGTARSGMIAADVTPALQREVEALRLQMAEVSTLKSLQEDAAQTLVDGLTGAQEARTALSQAIADRTDLPRRFEEDPVQIALLVASAQTLDAFATDLAANTGTDANPLPAVPKGALPLPVQGQLLRRFNAADAAGTRRPGVIIATRPGALITAPVPVTVLFTGLLLDHGQVAIVEPQPDVLFVLAGLDIAYGRAGEVLPAGAALGLMGGTLPGTDVKLTESDLIDGGNATQTLYLEVREGQSPVDPATWFALE
jgi:septal ring factor EnvC (AmiA/AmiB activator)